MKLIVELDYIPNVIGADPLTHLKGSIEKCCDGVKVIDIYKSAKTSGNPMLKDDGIKDGEILILETEKAKVTVKPQKKNERVISDHGKWDSYDSIKNMPSI